MKRVVLLVAAAVVLTLALSGTAVAASPQDIYDDYFRNGKLTGTYSEAELEAYLGDAAIRQYGAPAVVSELDALVNKMLADMREDGRDDFPFTGAQLLVVLAAALALLSGGLGLRRLQRN